MCHTNEPATLTGLASPLQSYLSLFSLPTADAVDQMLVNDTVIGDPVIAVPILVSDEQLQALNLTSVTMCYEIHGSSDQWFNLVTLSMHIILR